MGVLIEKNVNRRRNVTPYMKIKSFVLIVLATFCASSTMIFFYFTYLGYRCKAYRSNYRISIYVQIVFFNFVKYLTTTSKSFSIKGCDPNKIFIVTTLEIDFVRIHVFGN
jgi:hypothetical protein